MKSICSVTLFVEIEYEHEEHRERLIAELSKKSGLFGLTGAGVVKSGKVYGYSITPLDGVRVVPDLPNINTDPTKGSHERE